MPRLAFWKGKKGFYDIEDFFAVLVYTLILFLFLVILSLPMCSTRRSVELKSASEAIGMVNGDQLLLEMLRTKLPDNLPQVINEQAGRKYLAKVTMQTGFAEATPATVESEEEVGIYDGVDKDKAISLLSEELYTGETYAGFIDNLEFMVPMVPKKERSNIFAVVTRAVFVRNAYPPHIIESKPQLREFYVYPEVYVRYGAAGRFKDGEADLANPTPETKSVKPGFGSVTFSKPKLGESYAQIPMTDSSYNPAVASIKLIVREGVK